MFKKIIKFLFIEIFYNGHFQIFGSLAILIFVSQISNFKITWDLLVIIYLAFYFIYLHDRYKGLSIDILTNPTRVQHLKGFYNYIPFILGINLLTLIVMLSQFANFYSLVFILLIVILGFLYPLYFKKLTKKLPLFKNFYVALVFSILVFLPFIYYSIPFNQKLWLLTVFVAIFIFLRGLMMQFFLDLKDIEGDRKENLLTLAVLKGRENVFKILKKIIIITPLFLPILFFIFPTIFPKSVSFLLFLIPINFYYLHLVKNHRFFGFILASGEFIPLPILIYVGNLLL